jgi:hypothetical protein
MAGIRKFGIAGKRISAIPKVKEMQARELNRELISWHALVHGHHDHGAQSSSLKAMPMARPKIGGGWISAIDSHHREIHLIGDTGFRNAARNP